MQKMLRTNLNKIKAATLAAFTIDNVKTLKNVYALGFIFSSLGNIYIYVSLHLMYIYIVTIFNWFCNVRNREPEKKEVLFEETISEPNFKTRAFDKELKNIKPKGKIPFVLGWDGRCPFVADLNELIHILIAGRSGKGKSNFMNQLIQSILLWNNNLALFLCDFKKVELADYKPFPQCKVFFDAETLYIIVKNLRIEMQRRYELLLNVGKGQKTYKKIDSYNKNHPEDILPYAVLVIDEFADLSYIKNDELKENIWDEIKWILREGRAAGIYIILATQRPTKENIQPCIKSLMVTCIGFGTQNEQEASYCGVSGSKGLDKGMFIINGESLENVKMKSFLVSETDKTYFKLLEEYKNGI